MAWAPPESDRVESWAPPASDAPQDSTVAQRQQAARTQREARDPGWMGAIFPNLTAAGEGPIQSLAGMKAGFKDVAALPANLAAGAFDFIQRGQLNPFEQDDAALRIRSAMAGVNPNSETQNQRVVGGLALAGSALGGPFLRAVPAAVAKTAPGIAGLAARGGAFAKNAGRLVGAGVVESAPAAAYQAATGDVGGGLASLALGGALRPLSGIPKAAPAAADFVEKTAGAMSGVPGHLLQEIGPMGSSAFGQRVKAVAGKNAPADELGQTLIDRIKNFDQYLPNAAEVDEMVKKLPPVDVKRIISALEGSKNAIRIKGTPSVKTTGTAEVFGMPSKGSISAGKGQFQEVSPEFLQLGGPGELAPFSNIAPGYKRQPAGLLGMDEKGLPAIRKNPQVIPDAESLGETTYSQTTPGAKGKTINVTPEAVAADRKIDQVISLLKNAADKDGKVPAYVARMIKQQYDNTVGDAWGKESSSYITALKNARHDIAKSLEEAAAESGIPEYSLAMKEYTRKLSAVDKVAKHLGKSEATQRERVESMISNLYGANKAEKQRNFKELSDIMGEDFAEQARAIGAAKLAMPGGSLPLFPTQWTGRSMLGASALGGATQAGVPGLVAGIPVAAMSSPIAASFTVPAAHGLANLATGNMEGKVGRFASSALRNGSLASLASLRAYLQAENAQR